MEIINLKKQKPALVIKKALAVLKKGGLIVYPTETCYGLGADATNHKAIKKLLKYKGGRAGKAISVAVADRKMAEKYVRLNETAKNLYRNFLPGPLTVVSSSRGRVARGVEASNQTLGIRIPAYPLILKLLAEFGKPITATSANTSGKKQPYSLADWQRYTFLKRQAMINLFLDAGVLPKRQSSTVVDTTLNEPAILRQGEITIAGLPGQIFTTNSEAQTKKIAGAIFSRFQNLLPARPIIFALQGDLGSGKTQFAKGLAKALKITVNVPSPTFVLAREYPYRLLNVSGIFYHLDTWRMEKGEELLELGFEKMLQPGNVIAIEWLQKVKTILEKLNPQKVKVIWLEIESLSETKRKIKYEI